MHRNHDSDRRAHPNRSHALSRRRFLRGVGASVALPALASLRPLGALAADTGGAAAQAPLRLAYIYFPNGAHQGHWWPSGEGRDFKFNQTLAPLEAVKSKLQVIGGLDHLNATAGPDGAGDHARANATFLTGLRARKTAGSDIEVGVSVDQIAARQLGHLTRLPSLELTCDAVRKSGSCDSGYSCAYQFNLSWLTPTTPMAPEPDPRLVFERLFGAGGEEERRRTLEERRTRQRSILDFVLEDARSLERGLGNQDRKKLDQYLVGVREIERRIEQAEKFQLPESPDIDAPTGVPGDYGQHIDLMYDMLALAFQTDSTRVATFLLAHDGSNRSLPDLGVPEGHHDLSHHREDAAMMDKIAKFDRFYAERLARFLEKLDAMEDGDGRTVLDNSLITYGGGICDGNRHSHDNLPIVLAGSAGGAIETGRFVKLPSMPMSNLYLRQLELMGVEGVERFGDSTGKLEQI